MQKVKLLLRFGSALLKLSPGKIAIYLFLCAVSQIAIPLSIPFLFGELTLLATGKQPPDWHFGPFSTYIFWLALIILLIPARMLCRLAQTSMDSQMEMHLRRTLFDKVIRQTPEFFHRHNPAQLTNILTGTTIEAQMAVRAILVDPIIQFGRVVGATYLTIHTLSQIHEKNAWWLVAFMVLLSVLSVAVVQLKGEKPVYQSQRQFQEQRFAISSLVDSAVKSPEEIQSMDAEALFSGRHSAGLDALTKLKRRIVLTMEVVNSAIGLPTDIIQVVVLGLVVFQITRHNATISPAVVVQLLGYIVNLAEPFKAFAALGITASSSWPAVELVSRLLEEDNRIKDVEGSREIDRLEPTLEARDVDFRYAPQLNKVFDHLTLAVPPGKVTSLVGRMGQGKTTFFRLALRFYEPEEGQILLGGYPATEFTLKSLRQHAVMMSQFPAFFHDSVRDNFRLAKPDATDEEILRICEATGLLPILEKAIGPNPLDRNFAAGGLLSGGQKRLFALARCLLRNPTFLFLDEPTTNMDNNEKYQLIPIMRAACKGRTVVVVDHDIPWLLQFSDYFLILEHGHIAQEGTGEKLLHQPGLLRELYTLAVPAFEEAQAGPGSLG